MVQLRLESLSYIALRATKAKATAKLRLESLSYIALRATEAWNRRVVRVGLGRGVGACSLDLQSECEVERWHLARRLARISRCATRVAAHGTD